MSGEKYPNTSPSVFQSTKTSLVHHAVNDLYLGNFGAIKAQILNTGNKTFQSRLNATITFSFFSDFFYEEDQNVIFGSRP